MREVRGWGLVLVTHPPGPITQEGRPRAETQRTRAGSVLLQDTGFLTPQEGSWLTSTARRCPPRPSPCVWSAMRQKSLSSSRPPKADGSLSVLPLSLGLQIIEAYSWHQM